MPRNGGAEKQAKRIKADREEEDEDDVERKGRMEGQPDHWRLPQEKPEHRPARQVQF